MASDIVKATAAGKLILCGEYMLLSEFGCGISLAIDKEMSVSMQKRSDNIISIKSALGNEKLQLNQKPKDNRFEIIYNIISNTAISNMAIDFGVDIAIESNIDHTVGFGSSGALISCVVACLAKLQNKEFDLSKNEQKNELMNLAVEITRKTYHSQSSGIDIATSIFGGLIYYDKSKMNITTLPNIFLDNNLDILAIFTGHKTKTNNAIDIMNDKFSNSHHILNDLYREMYNSVIECKKAITDNNLELFASSINDYSKYLDILGVNDKIIAEIIDISNKNGAICSKVSGSGLGDCVISISNKDKTQNIKNALSNFKIFDINVNNNGLRYEQTKLK